VWLADRRVNRARAHQLLIAAIAARGKGDEIKKMIKDWNEE
jgi:hypothetical protein